MKIKLEDNKWLNSDGICYFLTQEVISENGNIRQERISGYYGSFQQAINSFIERKLLSSSSETLSDLSKEIENIKCEVISWKDKIYD